MDLTSPDLRPRVEVETRRLVATVRALDDAGAPSLCTGWSRGHVLSHVARNADGLAALVRAAVDGSGETQYASPEAREADIEAGAGRQVADLLEDVERSAAGLAEQLLRLAPEHAGHPLERTPGTFSGRAAGIPFLRLREVVYHHVDLDAGFGFADIDPDLQRLFLDEETRRLRRADPVPDLTLRTPEGEEWTVGVATASATGERGALLRWLARGFADGVAGDPLPRLPGGR